MQNFELNPVISKGEVVIYRSSAGPEIRVKLDKETVKNQPVPFWNRLLPTGKLEK